VVYTTLNLCYKIKDILSSQNTPWNVILDWTPYSWGRDSMSFQSPLPFQRGNSNITLALPTHAPQPLQVWSKSGSKKGHFNLEGQTVFRPYHASHWSGVTETSQLGIPPFAPQLLQFGHRQAVMTVTLLLMPKQFFVPISPRLQAGKMILCLQYAIYVLSIRDAEHLPNFSKEFLTKKQVFLETYLRDWSRNFPLS
jgi:hypothetical protein